MSRSSAARSMRARPPQRVWREQQGVHEEHSAFQGANAPHGRTHRRAIRQAVADPEGLLSDAGLEHAATAVADWLGPPEVSARLKVSRATVYALVKSGRLRHRRVGPQIRVPLSALDEFLSGSR